ncbi:hypothetical protein DUI87_17172 [Hirundo rustica rustica]|uniref:Uncharacterized protein n=1 Tax=Hirundo rustica rustica TaxID=333673 RepID=A0A3M0K355_HIRRU|nr:hypothetical protein DUI87_17172 [Hirundo rustica rustica]
MAMLCLKLHTLQGLPKLSSDWTGDMAFSQFRVFAGGRVSKQLCGTWLLAAVKPWHEERLRLLGLFSLKKRQLKEDLSSLQVSEGRVSKGQSQALHSGFKQESQQEETDAQKVPPEYVDEELLYCADDQALE